MASVPRLPLPQHPRRAAIYCRVSTPPQADEAHRLTGASSERDGTSLQTQEEGCRAYCVQQGYDVVGVFVDIHSGADLYGRPQLTALREAVRAGGIDIVVAYALDRLSRNQAHVYIIDDELEHHGCRLEFATEDYEDSAVGRFVRSGKAFAAEVEHEKILERSMRGKRARVRNGKYLPGSRPRYGYRWPERTAIIDGKETTIPDKSRLEVDPVRGPIVQWIFAMAKAGKALRVIALELTAEGVPPPTTRAQGWRHTTIRAMLTDPIYTGQAESFRYTRVKVKSRHGRIYYRAFRNEESLPLPEGTVPALVNVETFQAVQERLKQNKAYAIRNNHDPEAALLRAGFVRCGHCGRAMVAATGAGLYKCIADGAFVDRCPQRPTISIKRLDRLVWEKVTAILTEPELIAQELQRPGTVDPTADDLAGLERTLTKKKRQYQDELASVAAMGHLLSEQSQAALADQLRQTERTIQEHEREREALLARRAAWEQTQARVHALEDWCRAYAETFAEADYAHRRLALEALNVTVRVFKSGSTPPFVMDWGIPDPLGPAIVDSAS